MPFQKEKQGGFLNLSDHISYFRTDIYVASAKEKVPGATMELMAGIFLCKAFEEACTE
jgi:hypothetical protein